MKTAPVFAGFVWEVAEACFGIGFEIEEGRRRGVWSLSRGVMLVVVAEGLIACVAVDMRESGPPVLVSTST